MRGSLLLLSLLAFSCTCKKDAPPSPVSAQKCTLAALHVIDPDKCEHTCFGGDVAACDAASTLFQRGLHTRRDPGRALSIAAKGCDLGGAASCMNVATVLSGQFDHEWPDGGVYENAELRADYQGQARKAANRECAAGRSESCAVAANLAEGADAEAFAQKAIELMDKACTAKDSFACEQLANAYRTGALGVARDTAKEGALRATACTLGQPESCELAGNPKRGCELGSGEACLAWSLQVAGDESGRALKLACELRDGRACAALARTGQGDVEKLIQRACSLGHEAACAP